MSRNWIGVAEEERVLDEVQRRRRRLATSALTVSPQVGQLATAYADAYPWMEPGAMMSLTQAGLPPDAPAARAIADVAALEAAEQGQFDEPADDLPDPWYETLWEVSTGWAKPIVRTGLTVLATPFEELQAAISSFGTALFDETRAGEAGLVSDVGGTISALASEIADPSELLSDFWTNYTTKAARSSGVLALSDLLEGKHVDLGEGFIPGGQIWEEREAAKQRLTIDGYFVTPGRLIARTLTEPGTPAWQLVSGLNDAAQNILLDPAAVALGGLSKAQKAVRTFESTGLISGVRKTVHAPTAVNHYLTSNMGRRTIEWLAKNDDLDAVWRATNFSDLATARRLTRATDESEVFDILTEVLGHTVRERPNPGFITRGIGGIGSEYGRLFGGGARVRRSLANSRVGLEMPGQLLNPDDINDAARQLDRWMRNARVSDEVRRMRLSELSVLSDGDRIGLFEVSKRVMSDTRGVLVEDWGISRSRAQRLTQMFDHIADDGFVAGLDDLGGHQNVLGPINPMVDGKTVDMPRGVPLLESEMADAIPLPPTVRDIRRLTPTVRRLQGLYDSGVWKGTIDGLDGLMSSVWKPFQLLRGAYTLRVVGEEQVRMAGDGLDSLISHPFSAVAWNLSVDPKSRLGRTLAGAAKRVVEPKGGTTVTGEFMEDVTEHMAAMSRGAAGHAGLPGEVLTGKFVKAEHGVDPDFYAGWTTELQHLAGDRIMRRLAGGMKEGDLRSIGRKLGSESGDYVSSGNVVDDVKEWLWRGSGSEIRLSHSRMVGRGAIRQSKKASDRYVDVFVERLRNSTGGDTDLLEAVAKGKLGDFSLRDFYSDRKVARLLEESYDSAAPRWVKRRETIRVIGRNSRLDRAVDVGFDTLMSKPTNWLSRSPTFRQKYWTEAERLMAYAPRQVQEDIIKAARKANLGREAEVRLVRRMTAGEGDKLKTLAALDDHAKSYALTETKKLLYDLNRRSQFFDMMRLVFPFGEAWKEIIGAWTGIVRKNPSVIRRFHQGLEGARQPSLLPGAEPETGPDSGQGFFHPDPQTGEEVFTYPAGWAGKLLGVNEGGAGVSLVGRAAGLNIVSATVLPGFGPAVQLPANLIIPNTPNYDDLREIVMPFGAPEGSIVEQATAAVLPAWLETTLRSFEDPEKHRLFGNTVADVMRALVRQGGYDLHSTQGQQQLTDDATAKARTLYLIRGLAQSVLPTGPQFQWSTSDLEGNVVPVKLLSDELRRLTSEEYGGDRQAAFGEWVRRFGVDNVLATIGKSTAVVERPVTEKGDSWLRAHPDLERTFPITVGYFAPEPAVGEFDYDAYLRQFETSAREVVSPAEQLALANDFLGRIQWEQAKKIAAQNPSPQTSQWLAQIRDQIAESYPGFDGWVSRRVWQQRPSSEQQITELRKAITNPVLAGTDAGKGTILYFSAVEQASQWVAGLPGNIRHYQEAKAAEPIRDWLRSVAREIIAKHPDFARVWYGVFKRELADDEIGAAA